MYVHLVLKKGKNRYQMTMNSKKKKSGFLCLNIILLIQSQMSDKKKKRRRKRERIAFKNMTAVSSSISNSSTLRAVSQQHAGFHNNG